MSGARLKLPTAVKRGRDACLAGDGQVHELALEILSRMPRSLSDASGFAWFECEECAGEGSVPHVHDRFACADGCDPDEPDTCEDCDGDGGFEDEDPAYDLDDIIDSVTRRRSPRGTERVVTALAEIIRSNRLAMSDYEDDLIRWRQLRLPRLSPPPHLTGKLATR